MSFVIGSPFIRNDLEFVSLIVEGQSFMIHQIRKMIGEWFKSMIQSRVNQYIVLGLIIAVVRGYMNDDAIAQAFEPPQVATDNIYY